MASSETTMAQVHEALNGMRIGDVAELMKDWHPAVLGVMLQAVAKAKELRYPSYHPDYDDVLKWLQTRSGEYRSGRVTGHGGFWGGGVRGRVEYNNDGGD